MMEDQPPIKIRSQVIHEKKTETDIYMTKNSMITSLLPAIEKKIHKFGFVEIHALGAANYKALKLALMILKAHPNEILSDVKTETVETSDFIIPTKPGEERSTKTREVNAVHIRLSRSSSK